MTFQDYLDEQMKDPEYRRARRRLWLRCLWGDIVCGVTIWWRKRWRRLEKLRAT